ncbi:MAG: LOW QUALITY PROTEIN: hypothetical protein J3Q66DRAFT_327180 [Benniella sp.]|nr:MAG: LOW QUALITY PROTEIN: hypothetical protein J3Q66DRAFT_327180 [Benniella sp.]
MDIRRLLRPMCPLAKRQSFSRTNTVGSNGCSRPRKIITHTRLLHMDQNRHQQARNGSKSSSSYCRDYRISHHGADRSKTSSWQDRLFNPDQYRILKPPFMKWRYRQNPMPSPAMEESRMYTTARSTSSKRRLPSSQHPPQSPLPKSPASSIASGTETASRSTKAPNHTSLMAPSIPSPPSSSEALAQASSTPKPRRKPPGWKRRSLAGMHRFRQERHLKLKERSTPQPPSQLPNANRDSRISNRRKLLLRRNTRRAQRRKWESLSQVVLGADGPARRYLHVHYHHEGLHSRRTRFLGLQHFLRHTRMFSPRGHQAFRREMESKQKKKLMKSMKAKYSWWQPLVRTQRKLLMRLGEIQDLEGDTGRRAIRLAKPLLKSKGKGAKLPDGTLLYKICNKEFECFWESHQSSLGIASLEALPSSWRFSTEDFNTILEHCEKLKDWGNGVKIAQLLLKRYQLHGFNFRSSELAAPNTRTIHLLIHCGRTDRAKAMFNYLHRHYPYPIPIDVYTSFLGLLSATPGQIGRIEGMIDHLEAHGPPPTVVVYNTLLRANAFQIGLSHGKEFLKKMSKLGYTPDQQSFRILIDASLAKLDLAKAHYWLAEYGRQGFEIQPKMLDPFMQTCIERMMRCKKLSESVPAEVDDKTQSQEWMHKALHLLEFMSAQKIEPTATTFELLIKGFLWQGNLLEAKKILTIMRGRPHLYIPSPRIWTLFFEHHLAADDHSSAWRTLSEMQKALRTHANPNAKVPAGLYHQLYRHLLAHGKLSLAEKTLYELMIRRGRAQPTTKEVVDLIWARSKHPKDAERIYELLYSQTLETRWRGSKAVRLNRIVVQGPIQMGNVGVMHAKSTSQDITLRDDVWKTWVSMTHYFSDPQNSQELTNEIQKGSKWVEKQRSVLAIAFEQVAKALGKLYTDKSTDQKANESWDMGQIRRIIRMGLRPTTYGVSHPVPVPVSGNHSTTMQHIRFSGKNQLLIQRLFAGQDFLQPLLSRRDMDDISNESSTVNVDVGEKLKSCFTWTLENEIPIRIEGINNYLESLLSHQDFENAKKIAESMFLGDESNGTSSLSFGPNILNDHKALLPGGYELYEQVLYKGGSELAEDWTSFLEGRRRKQQQRQPDEPHLTNNPLDDSAPSPSPKTDA